ncbi:MAG: hypothetical protein AB1558_05250 [Thermodesulfobacteriota bacterium]
MNRKPSDRDWEKLQAHIEGFLGRAISGDVERIEYRPQFTVKLLEMPLDRHQNTDQDMTALTDDADRRKGEYE